MYPLLYLYVRVICQTVRPKTEVATCHYYKVIISTNMFSCLVILLVVNLVRQSFLTAHRPRSYILQTRNVCFLANISC